MLLDLVKCTDSEPMQECDDLDLVNLMGILDTADTGIRYRYPEYRYRYPTTIVSMRCSIAIRILAVC